MLRTRTGGRRPEHPTDTVARLLADRPMRRRPATIAACASAEALEDLCLACVSRAIDDREISLQKAQRGVLQISGAGHEPLLLNLATTCGQVRFFPY